MVGIGFEVDVQTRHERLDRIGDALLGRRGGLGSRCRFSGHGHFVRPTPDTVFEQQFHHLLISDDGRHV